MANNEKVVLDLRWPGIRKLFTAKLAELRDENDNTQLTEIETAVLRGKIEVVKEVLDLDTPSQFINVKSEFYIE